MLLISLIVVFLAVSEASSVFPKPKRRRTTGPNYRRTNNLLDSSASAEITAAVNQPSAMEAVQQANRCTLMNEQAREELVVLMRDCPKLVHILNDVHGASILIAQYLTSNDLARLTSTTKLLSRIPLSGGRTLEMQAKLFDFQRLLYDERLARESQGLQMRDSVAHKLLRWAYHNDYLFAQYILSHHPRAYFFSGIFHHSFGGLNHSLYHMNGLLSDPLSPIGSAYSGFRRYLFENVKLEYPYESYCMEDESLFWAKVFNTHLKAYLEKNPFDSRLRAHINEVYRRYPDRYSHS